MSEQRAADSPPPVTVTGGPVPLLISHPPGDDADVPDRRPTRVLVLLATLATAAAVVAGLDAPPPPPDPLVVELRLDGDAISTSRSGELVLPVEIVNHGPAVQITDTTVFAEPVRSEPSSNGEQFVASGELARRVVLMQPDCTLLSAGQGFRVAATVVFSLHGLDRQDRDVSLDLGAQPDVTEQVRRLCARLAEPQLEVPDNLTLAEAAVLHELSRLDAAALCRVVGPAGAARDGLLGRAGAVGDALLERLSATCPTAG